MYIYIYTYVYIYIYIHIYIYVHTNTHTHTNTATIQGTYHQCRRFWVVSYMMNHELYINQSKTLHKWITKTLHKWITNSIRFYYQLYMNKSRTRRLTRAHVQHALLRVSLGHVTHVQSPTRYKSVTNSTWLNHELVARFLSKWHTSSCLCPLAIYVCDT